VCMYVCVCISVHGKVAHGTTEGLRDVFPRHATKRHTTDHATEVFCLSLTSPLSSPPPSSQLHLYYMVTNQKTFEGQKKWRCHGCKQLVGGDVGRLRAHVYNGQRCFSTSRYSKRAGAEAHDDRPGGEGRAGERLFPSRS